MYPALKRLTLDIASAIFMAAELGASGDRVTRAFIDTVRAGTALIRLPVGRWGAGLRGRQVLEYYFRASLPAKRASDSDDLFAALCHARTDEGEVFTDDDVVNHMIFLMMAAHDTSTITTRAVAYYLGKHPEWQEKVRAESLALGDAPPDMAALDTLGTLDLVIKESMRLVTPVPSLVRRTVRDTDLLGHYVPSDTLVVGHAVGEPPAAGVLARTHTASTRSGFARGPPGGQGAPVRVDAFRGRGAQVHRHAFRHVRGEIPGARTGTPFRVDRSGGTTRSAGTRPRYPFRRTACRLSCAPADRRSGKLVGGVQLIISEVP